MFRGRFNSVDPGHTDANLLTPQSWNAYGYARNNPLRFADPRGLGADDDLCFRCLGVKRDPEFVDWFSNTFFGNYFFESGGDPGNKGRGGVRFFPPVQPPHSPVDPVDPVDPSDPQNPKDDPCGAAKGHTDSKDKKECSGINDGIDGASQALKNDKCSNFYHGRGQELLDGTKYTFSSDFNSGAAVARTLSSTSVLINVKGDFLSYFPPTQRFGQTWAPKTYRGLVFLHELAHQAGIYGFDAGYPDSDVDNNSHTYEIIRNCFPG